MHTHRSLILNENKIKTITSNLKYPYRIFTDFCNIFFSLEIDSVDCRLDILLSNCIVIDGSTVLQLFL